jgi:hypothetical protein
MQTPAILHAPNGEDDGKPRTEYDSYFEVNCYDRDTGEGHYVFVAKGDIIPTRLLGLPQTERQAQKHTALVYTPVYRQPVV